MLNRLLPGIMKGVMWFGACILGIIMILITVDVCLRYFFHSPIQGSYELVEVLMGMLSPVVITYCAWHRGHVGVDLFFDKFIDLTGQKYKEERSKECDKYEYQNK